jgi:murein DD-endopeptidase MepM/ murein hydrolase activator NlpD
MRKLGMLALGVAGVGMLAACGAQPPLDEAPAPAANISTTPAPALAIDACPVTGARWGDGFGPRGTGFHSGIDLLIAEGTPLVAVRAGRVHYVADEGAGGNTVYLTADDNTAFQYAHLSAFAGVDRRVAAGELIGYVGHTGNATASHVHFGVRLNGVAGTRIDPAPTLHAKGC